MRDDKTTLKRKARLGPKITPWPGCSFDLKMEWMNDALSRIRHLWVHLDRRAAGRFGRLEVMHALVPAKNADPRDRWMFGARFHRNLYLRALDVFKQAGVPGPLREKYLRRMAGELPIPTDKEVFLHSLDSPAMNKVIGDRKKDLSYFQTGRPELTKEDLRFIKERLDEKLREMRKGPNGFEESARLIQEMML